MKKDPLEQLLEGLLDAHDRQQAQAKVRRRLSSYLHARWRVHTRVVTLTVAALVLSASAATAVVIATDQSAPLRGELPRQLLGSRYALEVHRDRQSPGRWCVSLIAIASGTPLLGSQPRCIRPGRSPLILRGGVSVLSAQTGHIAGYLLYAIVTRDIATLREPNGRTIVPISAASLPRMWRAAVIIETDPKSLPGVPVTLTPIDRDGRPVLGP